jgi:hypothetical protein
MRPFQTYQRRECGGDAHGTIDLQFAGLRHPRPYGRPRARLRTADSPCEAPAQASRSSVMPPTSRARALQFFHRAVRFQNTGHPQMDAVVAASVRKRARRRARAARLEVLETVPGVEIGDRNCSAARVMLSWTACWPRPRSPGGLAFGRDVLVECKTSVTPLSSHYLNRFVISVLRISAITGLMMSPPMSHKASKAPGRQLVETAARRRGRLLSILNLSGQEATLATV